MITPAVFIGGPFHHAILSSGVFDPELEALIVNIIESVESAGFTVLSSHRAEDFGRVALEGPPEDVAHRDFGWMQECSAYVCLLPNFEEGNPYRSDGCCIELGWASVLKRPTILVRDMRTSFTDLLLGLGALGPVRHLPVQDVAHDATLVVATLHHLLKDSGYDNGAPTEHLGAQS